jgi:uncharacterized protein
MSSTAPAVAPQPHLQFSSAVGNHLFVSAYSRLFDLPPGGEVDFASGPGLALLDRLSRPGPRDESLAATSAPNPQSISLNVSASCNLACGYCYAGQGGFGGKQVAGMSWETAHAAVDRLLQGADALRPITIGFLGGEPFVNRRLIHQVVRYASEAGRSLRLDVRFSVTTNATLLKAEDLRLMRSHPFAVTVSLDGQAATHDRNRPTRAGGGSWVRAITAIRPLLESPGSARLAARATVRREDMRLGAHFDALAEAGFNEIGFSPLRSGPTSAGAIAGDDWNAYLEALTALADRERARARAGLPIRLTNLAVALKQLHRGFASPYPCGAGGGYFSVASDGDWYACHRAVGDEEYRLGNSDGLDAAKRAAFLEARHVDAQTDCRTCWARYLCSGGCHQEAKARSPQSCDFVRGWLHYCLVAYCELRGPLSNSGGEADARS